MKKTINLFLILFLFSCKGEPIKKEIIDNTKTNTNTKSSATVQATTSSNKISTNCYEYLTELVRSSNFPFSEWKIDKNKINLLIDEENDDIILCKLLFDTDGTGTVGWIEYHKKNGKLFNTSANLENPLELKYDVKWKKLFDSCFSKKENSDTKAEVENQNILEKVYNDCEELSLPIKYNYDEISEEKGFKDLNKGSYSIFPIKHEDNYKIIKLPIINNIKPIILIKYNEAGQST
ncbi:hypothetical protein GCM10023210_03330 [Chryseobacterium ginsengisoli]|uniref:Lipoprotein n=1 Tax=Chryseobacterium ginsengisoli TaxID=363853 RepID=A0ABP9LW63_9FLAO